MLAEVELACDRIGLIRDGRLVRVGSLADLRELRVHHVEAVLPRPPDSAARSGLAAIPGVGDVAAEGHTIGCSVQGPITPLLGWLADHGATEVDSRELTLEEVFLAEYQHAA